MARRSGNETKLVETYYDKTVRFYFEVSISCLIPRNPHRRRGGAGDAAWEERQMERVREDLIAALPIKGLDIGYRDHEVVDDLRRLYVAHFVVSVAQNFHAAESWSQRKGESKFSVKSKRFLTARKDLATKIRNALRDAWVVNAISYEFAASWGFAYEGVMDGVIELRHVISQSDIDAADGSVRQAIEAFNLDVDCRLKNMGFGVNPRTIARRPQDNVYKFDIWRRELCVVWEDDVSGEMALLGEGMDGSDVPYIELKDPRQSFEAYVEMARDSLACCDYPEDTELVRATLDLWDYDEDLDHYFDSLGLA